MSHSPLISAYFEQIKRSVKETGLGVLDLACGSGRNGLFLLENNIPVTFADVNSDALEQVKKSVKALSASKQKLAKYWQVDFEQANVLPLQDQSFFAVTVFRYLHRPLFEQIKDSIVSGGIIIYETFTEQQAQFGRPKNPDFLLKKGELVQLFSDWKIIHSFEGIVPISTATQAKQAIAQLVAIKSK